MRTILISALLACFVAMLDARSVAGTIVVVFLFNFFYLKLIEQTDIFKPISCRISEKICWFARIYYNFTTISLLTVCRYFSFHRLVSKLLLSYLLKQAYL